MTQNSESQTREVYRGKYEDKMRDYFHFFESGLMVTHTHGEIHLNITEYPRAGYARQDTTIKIPDLVFRIIAETVFKEIEIGKRLIAEHEVKSHMKENIEVQT